jgi:tRNA1(Val) A37 N6-methylase TrmN6
VVTGDVATAETAGEAVGHGPFAHAMANPPWFAGGTAPAHPPRRGAKHADDTATLAAWAALLGHCLARRGTARVILPPALLPEALAAFAQAGIGSPTLLPLWPRAGEAARRLILAGRKGGRAACRILPGLVLHERDGRFTDDAEAVLRHAAPLPME